MKKTILLILVLMTVLLSAFASGKKEQNPNAVKVGISKLMAHPALDLIEKGIVDAMNDAGIEAVYNLQNANGESSTAASIAQLFKTSGQDIVVGIATPTAQALANVFSDIPVIYATVTDVEAAGLSGIDNVCGTSDAVPFEEHFNLVEKVSNASTIGMVYTSSEANGIASMEAMKEICEKNGVGFVSAAVSNTSEVRLATQSIVDRVDAFYVANDNTVVSAINALTEVALEKNVPVISADTTSSFGTDVLIAGGFDYYKSGIITGEIVAKVLRGEKPSDIGVVYLTGLEYYINLDVAKKLGITIPEDLLSEAKYLVEDGITIEKT